MPLQWDNDNTCFPSSGGTRRHGHRGFRPHPPARGTRGYQATQEPTLVPADSARGTDQEPQQDWNEADRRPQPGLRNLTVTGTKAHSVSQNPRTQTEQDDAQHIKGFSRIWSPNTTTKRPAYTRPRPGNPQRWRLD